MRQLVSEARRQKLAVHEPRLNKDRDPHPRRDYWRAYKAAKRQAS